MERRNFIKWLPAPIVGWLGLKVTGCGTDIGSGVNSIEEFRNPLPNALKIWSFYAPLSRYEGIIEEGEHLHKWDRKVDFERTRQRNPRINGRRSDGTENREILDVDALRNSEEDFVRVRFWHDDQNANGQPGHTLYVFKRHLDDLAQGKKVFIATGMILDHFHIVMIDPNA